MQNILIQYLAWQFIDTPKDILGGWRNCLKFNLNYWSVPLLLKTWPAHWRRFRYSYGRGFAFKRYFEVFTFNIISRVMGAFFRSVFIVLGILTEILVVAAGVVVFLAWLFLPLLLAGGFYYGFKILF
ncbi:MAG: hypothetical protein A2896_02445 [Candidatus Nealsonbacteria bacterium RIFCSPLOWO2_01_FULL_43_32]|uniref:Uncharacterized protein n=1 Tax=Candidatus Nealsonbacteria bacterium RIFCSPLOWO2_01_FULL_43_32 TaxID=1801672 RepID=A0A1G2EG08_9BACT|nr:MAG: hypothetical protein A2896_02445 [Candidatus Nealsonbacteria bacterium RIFCSPLOWO2_01_FULL_43_32]